ncbi:MAG TPA: cation diffusion facilitator family transporter [Ignavibacteriaceae bacterium]|nr:cation diffusion facilitator family transporter [Ignavibacteriaceae bacterium]
MAKILKRATNLSLIANIFLFGIKLFAGIISNSIAVISDAINSLTDIVSSLAILYSVRVSLKKPDDDHQFGHNAAQPIAVFIIALFTAVVGINLIEASVDRIIHPELKHNINFLVYSILGITIIIKFWLSRYQSRVSKTFRSPGLKASAIDSLNDVLASSLSIVGLIGVQFGLSYIDGVAGILISFFILKSGYEIAKENINYLMGKAADEDLIVEIATCAMQVEGVSGINDLRSHYVGNKFHVEIHIEVDKDMSTENSHDVGKDVQKAIESINEIQKAFVHIDPV